MGDMFCGVRSWFGLVWFGLVWLVGWLVGWLVLKVVCAFIICIDAYSPFRPYGGSLFEGSKSKQKILAPFIRPL
ncbi:hypothetical protein, partial [Pseudomonas sp. NPDC089406]|uniref:hypothetical protein n=1 Tax=Pseudomonas sp. NPDC089406 TaxID=3364463 RepID=UPI00384B985F